MDKLLYLQNLASIGHKNVQSEALFVDVIRCMRGSIRFRYPERTKSKSFLQLRSKLCSHTETNNKYYNHRSSKYKRRNCKYIRRKSKIQPEKILIHPEAEKLREYAEKLREYAEKLREKIARKGGEIAGIHTCNSVPT